MSRPQDRMNAHASAWTDEQIEAFHDGELESELARALSEDLAADDRLRERLRTIQRCDEIVVRALTGPSERPACQGASAPRLDWRSIPTMRTIAATLVACAGIVLAALALRPGSAPDVVPSVDLPTPARAGDATIARDARPRSRVLVSLSGRDADALFDEPAPVLAPMRDVQAEALSALAEGDIERTLELTRTQSPSARREALAALGLALSVEQRALKMLDAMTPIEQLEACEVWASDPRFRAATFSRLRDLASHPELGPRVRDLLKEMESQPDLSAWVRSYRPRS